MAATTSTRRPLEVLTLMDMDIPMNSPYADTSITDRTFAAASSMPHPASTFQFSAQDEDSVIAPIREKLQGVSLQAGAPRGPLGMHPERLMRIAAGPDMGRGEVVGSCGDMVVFRASDDVQTARSQASRYGGTYRRYHDRGKPFASF